MSGEKIKMERVDVAEAVVRCSSCSTVLSQPTADGIAVRGFLVCSECRALINAATARAERAEAERDRESKAFDDLTWHMNRTIEKLTEKEIALARAEAAIQRVRELHYPWDCEDGSGRHRHCEHCGQKDAYPCPTIAALDSTETGEAAPGWAQAAETTAQAARDIEARRAALVDREAAALDSIQPDTPAPERDVDLGHFGCDLPIGHDGDCASVDGEERK